MSEKNLSGKPYLDYICEIKNKENTNKLHRKLVFEKSYN